MEANVSIKTLEEQYGEMLEPERIADFFGVSVRTVNRWIAARELRSYKLAGAEGGPGGIRRVAKVDVDAFMEKRRAK